ncbi:hypothetical protein BDD12DRAFT_882162 [Trichophaea hybrida]|nr:hypothetical protein BDD12DRAFT_882162 [Trichophaea hybrida]
MANFPTLKPFATLIATIDPPLSIGSLSIGGSQTFVNISSATLASERGSPPINASLIMGGDWIHADPSGKYLRLDVRSVLKTDDDATITFTYTGIITITPEIQKVLSGAEDAKTTDFGNIVIVPKFQTGAEKYKFLEDSVFVASGRFIVGAEKGTSVEYKISKVIA